MADSLDRPLPEDLSDHADRLMHRLADRGLRIATAESCTGGLLAALLTDIEGASHAFERGVVTYADDAKVDLLGIDREVLRENDAVSEAVARAMAESMLTRSKADLSAAITGFAGAGAPGTEEGLVHLAVAGRGIETRHRVEHFGSIGRGPVRICALRSALELVAATVAAIGGARTEREDPRAGSAPDAVEATTIVRPRGTGEPGAPSGPRSPPARPACPASPTGTRLAACRPLA